MLRLRSRLLISLALGAVTIGFVILLVFFGEHPDEKLVADFHRSPLIFVLVWTSIGLAIAVAIFIVLSLISWVMKRWPAQSETGEGVRQLYSPNQAFAAAILGGPLAAVSLIKSNYLMLEKPRSAKKSVVFGWSYFLVLIAIITTLIYKSVTLKGLGTGIGIGTAIAAQSLVSIFQRTKQAILASDRYSFRSNWRVVGLGLLYFGASFAILFITSMFLISIGYHPPR